MSAVCVLSHGFNVMRGVLADKKYSDLNLMTVDGKVVTCHKVVLSSVSDKVRLMLDKKDASQLVIRNVSHEGLDNLVRFIYEGRVDIKSDECLVDFADAFTVLRCNMGQKIAEMVKNITIDDGDVVPSQLSHAKQNKCETCDKSFRTMKKLNRHFQQVHNRKSEQKIMKPKLYACERCKTEYKVPIQTFFFISIIITTIASPRVKVL